ncbi:hypothetical protein AA16663_1839 [Komagataeibacter rhaeticus DSM 16663]|nr:hypothetical protein AA16663_1839 [Komagataeibacter rhaeticus DSM 16663]
MMGNGVPCGTGQESRTESKECLAPAPDQNKNDSGHDRKKGPSGQAGNHAKQGIAPLPARILVRYGPVMGRKGRWKFHHAIPDMYDTAAGLGRTAETWQ